MASEIEGSIVTRRKGVGWKLEVNSGDGDERKVALASAHRFLLILSQAKLFIF